jgi:Domain of unknown function (DUF1996)
MKRRESQLTHRQRSNEASLAWLLVCTVGAALLAVMIVTQGALAHPNHDPQARWFQKCGLAKRGTFDPIVYPNTPPPVGTQKLFYGATAISYNSTKTTLLNGGTTCRFNDGTSGGNRSAYWVPDLLRDGTTLVGGKQLNAYYGKGAPSVDPHVIVPFPDGLKMVARDTNTSQTGVKWYCSNINGEGNNGNMQERPYNCNPNGTYPYVTANISFPQCGNGDVDTTDPQKYPNPPAGPGNDHISHVVYAGSGGCPPDTHPNVYPRLFITAKYNTSRGSGALLAGGRDPATDFRSYFFEAWKPGKLQFLVENCINAGINCNSTRPAG